MAQKAAPLECFAAMVVPALSAISHWRKTEVTDDQQPAPNFHLALLAGWDSYSLDSRIDLLIIFRTG